MDKTVGAMQRESFAVFMIDSPSIHVAAQCAFGNRWIFEDLEMRADGRSRRGAMSSMALWQTT